MFDEEVPAFIKSLKSKAFIKSFLQPLFFRVDSRNMDVIIVYCSINMFRINSMRIYLDKSCYPLVHPSLGLYGGDGLKS